MAYDYKTTLLKGLKGVLFYGVPAGIAYAVNFYPTISGLTVGTVATMFANWLKNKNN